MRFRLLIDRERCKGCALCIAACFRNVLSLNGRINTRGHQYVHVENGAECAGCRKCGEICPDAAIEIAKCSDEGEENG